MAMPNQLALMISFDGALDIVLNILKLLGLLTGAVAFVLGTVRETKDSRERLTREGWWILSAGVVGFVVAAVAQLVDWRAGTIKSHEAELKNQEILLRIDRSLRRLDTITMDVTVDAPLNATLLKTLNTDLTKQLVAFNKLPNHASIESWHGLRELDEHRPVDEHDVIGPRNETLWVKESEWEVDTGPAIALFEASRPSIAIYKNPINATTLSYKTFPQSPAPDLLLTPAGGETYAMIEADYDLKKQTIVKGPTVSITTTNMAVPVSTWRASMNVDSLDDLKGAQIIVFSAYQVRLYDTDAWFESANPRLSLYVNHHRIPIPPLKRIGGDEGVIGFEANLPRDFDAPSSK
jgi:hypothetical protein